jgi:NADH dehydrogenase
MNIPPTSKKRIVIIGGGFGGLSLAKSLRKSDFQVVLIDKNNYHAFQPLFYQVATAGLEPGSIAYPFRKIFANYQNFYFRMAEVISIDATKKTVCSSIGEVNYDYLVLATGATSNFFGLKNVEEKSTDNFKISGKNIEISAENSLTFTVNNSKIMVEKTGISIITDQKISISSDKGTTCKSAKTIILQSSKKVEIRATEIIIGQLLKIKNNIATFGTAAVSLVKSAFINLYNCFSFFWINVLYTSFNGSKQGWYWRN